MRLLSIILLTIGAAILYGIFHDLITAHLCVEYFTVAHPRVLESENPTLLAFTWGVLATWWVGLILGIPLAIVSRAGYRPVLSVRQLIRPIFKLLLTMACFATLAGSFGYLLAVRGMFRLEGPLASEIPAQRQPAFIADAAAHLASYAAGFIGGLVLCGITWRRRARLARPEAEANAIITGGNSAPHVVGTNPSSSQ